MKRILNSDFTPQEVKSQLLAKKKKRGEGGDLYTRKYSNSLSSTKKGLANLIIIIIIIIIIITK